MMDDGYGAVGGLDHQRFIPSACVLAWVAHPPASFGAWLGLKPEPWQVMTPPARDRWWLGRVRSRAHTGSQVDQLAKATPVFATHPQPPSMTVDNLHYGSLLQCMG